LQLKLILTLHDQQKKALKPVFALLAEEQEFLQNLCKSDTSTDITHTIKKPAAH